jgi:NitT/TauT family transport system substrate-binding protein
VEFATVKEFLTGVAKYESSGAKLNATYVYDRTTGLKMFGKSALYVLAPSGNYATFLRKNDAEKYAEAVKGKVFAYAEAVASGGS